MANFFNPDYKIEDLIAFTESSVKTANFQQIRDSLIKKMQDIYGNDIDISSASADGQWVNALALLYDKTFGVVKSLENSMNVDEASGHYLDILCSYNNIFRKEATKSKAQVVVVNTGVSAFTIPTGENPVNNLKYQYLKFQDINGNIWTWMNYASSYDNGSEGIVFNKTSLAQGEKMTIEVECDDYGKITAYKNPNFDVDTESTYISDNKGDINTSIEPSLQVWQYSDAIVGSDEETDDALRTRRALELGTNSTTVLSGLDGTLREVAGVNDVVIFNNDNGGDITLKANPGTGDPLYYGDNTTVKNHDIYVVVRKEKGIEIQDSEVAKNTIRKLTPGVRTTQYNNAGTLVPKDTANEYGISKIYAYAIQFGSSVLEQNVYWKISKPRAIPLTLSFMINKNFVDDSGNQIYLEKIINNIKDYTFNLSFKQDLTIAGIINEINSHCVSVNGSMPYICVSGQFSTSAIANVVTPDNNNQYQHNHLAYFDYGYGKKNTEASGTAGYIDVDTYYRVSYSKVALGSGVTIPAVGYVTGTLTITVSTIPSS